MAHLLRLRSVSLLFVLIVISMSLPRTTVAQSIPHLIYGNLENYLGEFPAEADLEFCVTLRPGEPTEQTLCYPDPDQFGWDYSEETGGWRAECSEFNFWVVDDIVEVTFSTPLAAGSVQGNLDSSPAQNMGLTIIWYLPIIDPVCLPVETDEDIVLVHDLTPCATDIEDLPEDLTWEVIDWDVALWASVEIVDNILTMTPLLNAWGVDEVTFSVTDSNGMNDSEVVILTVNSINDPPVIDLPDTLEFDEDGSLAEDFSPYLSDVETATPDLQLFTSGGDEIDVLILDQLVVFSAPDNWFGVETILFQVTDGEHFIEDSLFVAVLSINDAPVAADVIITPENPEIDDQLVAAFTYSDIENDPESGSIYSWFRNGELVPELDGLLTVDPVNTDFLEVWYFEITPSDGEDFGETVQSNNLVIGNSDPVLVDIPDTPVLEDSSFQLDLYPFLTDDEQQDNEIILTLVSNSDEEHLAASVVGQFLIASSLIENYSDPATIEIIVQANDQYDGFDTDTLLVTIVPVNDAPILDSGCLPLSTDEDTPLVHDLTDCASDIEDAAADLNWDILDWDVELWETVEIVNNILTMTPLADISGQDEVTLTVTDNGEAGGDELSDSALITLTINPINDAPVIDEECLPVATDEDVPLVQDLTECASDIEDAAADLNWDILDWDNELWETVEIVDNVLTMTPLLNVTGADEVTLTVTDNGEAGSDELSDSALITLTLNPINDAPEINLPDSMAFDEDLSLEVDFAPFLGDVDSDTSLILTAAGNTEIAIAIEGFIVTFTATENWFGPEEITFTIDDQDLRLIDSDLVTVVVNPVNDLPVVDLECLVPITPEDVTLVFALTGCATDIEDAAGDLVWSLYEGAERDWDPLLWESFTIVDNLLTAVPLADTWGPDAVTFIVTDLEGGVTELSAEVMIECRLDYTGVTTFSIDRGSELVIDLDFDGDCGAPDITGVLPAWLTLNAEAQTVSGIPTVQATPQLFSLTFTLEEDTLRVDFSVELLGTLITEGGHIQVEIATDDGGYLRFVFTDLVNPPFFLVITEIIVPGRTLSEDMAPWIWSVVTDLPNDVGGYAELFMPVHLPDFMQSLDYTPTHLYFYNRLDAADPWTRQAETTAQNNGTMLILNIDGLENSQWAFGAWYQDVLENKLWQNYPNPFNDETRIGCDIVNNGTPVEVTIYNPLGDKIWEDDAVFDAGNYLQNYFTWNGRNSLGTPVGSGVYIIRVKIDGKVSTKQTVFLRGN